MNDLFRFILVRPRTDRRGFALIAVLVVMVVLGLIGGAALKLTAGDQKVTRLFADANQAMALGLFLTPVPGGLVAGLVENLGVALGAQLFFDSHVVVDEEVARHIEHRQRVGGPDAGFVVDQDGHFGGVGGHMWNSRISVTVPFGACGFDRSHALRGSASLDALRPLL